MRNMPLFNIAAEALNPVEQTNFPTEKALQTLISKYEAFVSASAH
jgi:hypothetical protein